jgi:hypothetical protein
VLGIRKVPISLSDYYRRLDDPHRSTRVLVDDDGMPLAGEASTIWQTTPSPPEGFLDETEFALTFEEARYLHERAEAASPHRTTLLRLLFEHGRPDARCDYPWRYPWLETAGRLVPEHVREEVEVAELFSLGHHGAALLFNLLIANARSDEDRQDDYRARIAVWQAEAAARLADFDLTRLWALVPPGRGTVQTRDFIEKWFDLVRLDGDTLLDDNPKARELVRRRELRVKGPQRSRIANPFRVAWNGGSGSGRLDFRWAAVQQIVIDVAEGRGHA